MLIPANKIIACSLTIVCHMLYNYDVINAKRLECRRQKMTKEELRKFRKERADRRAKQLENWAYNKEKKAKQIEDSWPDFIHDIAFNTQPGHIPFRARIIKQQEKVFQLREEAKRLREKAKNIRIYKSRVKGDAEARRELERKEQDKIIKEGDYVYSILYGRKAIVQKVFKKSYRLKFDDINHPVLQDKTFVQKITKDMD